jgi:hypothetical protein
MAGPAEDVPACVGCGAVGGRYFYCDARPDDGPWCGGCFLLEPCWDVHPEACATLVLDEAWRPEAIGPIVEDIDLSRYEEAGAMGKPWSIKGYGEQQIIDAVLQRWDQWGTARRVIAQLFWTDLEEG